MNTATTGTPPEALRASMVDHVMEAGHARSGAVEEGMRTVPRTGSFPLSAYEDAYADRGVYAWPSAAITLIGARPTGRR